MSFESGLSEGLRGHALRFFEGEFFSVVIVNDLYDLMVEGVLMSKGIELSIDELHFAKVAIDLELGFKIVGAVVFFKSTVSFE